LKRAIEKVKMDVLIEELRSIRKTGLVVLKAIIDLYKSKLQYSGLSKFTGVPIFSTEIYNKVNQLLPMFFIKKQEISERHIRNYINDFERMWLIKETASPRRREKAYTLKENPEILEKSVEILLEEE